MVLKSSSHLKHSYTNEDLTPEKDHSSTHLFVYSHINLAVLNFDLKKKKGNKLDDRE